MALVTLLPFPFIAWMIQVVRTALAARFCPQQRRLGRDGQRAGRHDSRHPRREGVRPGAARDRPLPPPQSARAGCQRPRQSSVVVLRSDGDAADGLRHAGDLGVRSLERRQRSDHRGRADGVRRVHRPVVHAAGFDEPHVGLDAAGGRGHASHFRDPRPRADRWPSRYTPFIRAGWKARSSFATCRSNTAIGRCCPI